MCLFIWFIIFLFFCYCMSLCQHLTSVLFFSSVLCLSSPLVFLPTSCPVYSWDEEPRGRSGTHSSAPVWSGRCAHPHVRVVQGREKVRRRVDCLSYILTFTTLHRQHRSTRDSTRLSVQGWVNGTCLFANTVHPLFCFNELGVRLVVAGCLGQSYIGQERVEER